MRFDLTERVIGEAEYLINFGATVRDTAKEFKVGKTTVHKDVTERLKAIDRRLYKRARKVLDKNLKERHIRGGEATKRYYLSKKQEKN